MGEKGQAMLQNMDLISDVGHAAQSVGNFVGGGANAVQYVGQSVINDLGTNNSASGSATPVAGAGQTLQGTQPQMQGATTPQSQPLPGGEKGNLQTASSQFVGQSVEGAASRGSAIASADFSAGATSPTVGGASPAASPTINPTNPIGGA